jgi:hypothetical protein
MPAVLALLFTGSQSLTSCSCLCCSLVSFSITKTSWPHGISARSGCSSPSFRSPFPHHAIAWPPKRQHHVTLGEQDSQYMGSFGHVALQLPPCFFSSWVIARSMLIAATPPRYRSTVPPLAMLSSFSNKALPPSRIPSCIYSLVTCCHRQPTASTVPCR